MKADEKKLKSFIIDAGLVDKKELDSAEKIAKKTRTPLQDILISKNLISGEEAAQLKAYILGVPFVNLEKMKIPAPILKIIPEPIAKTYNIVAFRQEGNNLEVAMLDPGDLRTIEFIRKKTGIKILPRLTGVDSIKSALRQYQKTLEAEFGDIIKKEAGGIRIVKAFSEEGENKDLRKVAEELPIIRIVDTLLRHAVIQRSSDIHIEPTEKEVIVRYRIDGILHDAMILPSVVAPGIVARIKVLSNLKLDEHRLPQDGRFKMEDGEYEYSIRVSILPIFTGEKIVMRLLAENSEALGLEDIGLRGEALERIRLCLKKTVGMILVTGPTGSGKTTTLYSVLEMLNTPEVNISTIEDPVEYRMPRVNQTQVNSKIGLTFASGLRSLVRQDPDIIMVGEIRDNETAALAINAALTGHLVLSTLHTTNAAGAVPRLVDMKAEPFLISSTISVIAAQRLVRKLLGGKKSGPLSESEISNLAKYCDLEKISNALREEGIIKKEETLKDIVFYKPEPTKACPDGFKGRIGIFEVLKVTETIKDLINKGADSDRIQDQAVREGMQTMIEDGFVKAAQGLTTIEEVLRVIIE
ncbi:MAG: GspE/PulE family protein [bacterium]|nr:GspE/PulE family protein [bacterium]